ncbi:hypothetical protein PVAND_008043 [Polypedilum vanderplanki]|uniref:Uncharacterized protein n=1 Tax=Polypedilum vanderplanki TaxID=319348 RepID=A0A9J6C8H3_POLVA|nr:hypothetical protein PVAND_008043 [Polypedilum vanderplanki]
MELPHNYASPKHQRYPMSPWYSHDYYNNWILNPDDRRHFPDSQTFFSSMRNSKKNHHFYSDKLHKAQQLDTSPSSIKRTKRKAKVDESTIKKDTGKELIKNLTPLPGFLQTFGQTEIGKFSEAFYISSDSPHYQYNESDIDSPQPYDFDSLDGPIPKSFYICGSENDSPMSSFSEIMCKDF